jgi:hypothetical protein
MDKTSRNMHRFAISLAGIFVACATVPAMAEKPDLIPREDYERPAAHPSSLPERTSESMEPRGGRVGSFVILPSIELGTAFDSNVFATTNNEQSDVIFSVLPAVRARSDLASPVRLNFDAVGVVNRFVDNDSEDTEGYLISHDGSWEIPALGEQSFIKWGLANARDWQDRGSPDDVTGAAEPTIIHTSLGYAGFQYKPGPLSISPRVSARYVDLDDVTASNGTNINNDDRDRWIYREGLRVGYEFLRGYEAFVRGTVNQRRYENTPDDAGFNRDSNGWESVGGVRIGLTEITSFEAYAGYLSQSYDDSRLSDVSGMSFGGRLNWSPRREWQFAASVDRTVEETILTDFSGYLATTYAISAYYQLMPALRFDARLGYSTFDFERIPGSTAQDREDDMITGQIGVRYYLTPNYYVRASWVQNAYSSNVPSSDYDRSIVYLTLGAQY